MARARLPYGYPRLFSTFGGATRMIADPISPNN